MDAAVEVEKQKKFSWLKVKNHLPVDIYLPKYNVVIECQGIQHFVPVEAFGGKKAFDVGCKYDKLKFELCKSHGIKVYYYSKCKENGEIDFEYPYKVYEDLGELYEMIKLENKR